MENFDDNIENEYRSRFEDFEETPDDLLWNNIQARIVPEKERPLVIWWNGLGRTVGMAASLLIGLTVGAYFLLKTDNSAQVSSVPNNSKIEKPQKSVVDNKTDVSQLATAEPNITKQLSLGQNHEKFNNQIIDNKAKTSGVLATNTPRYKKLEVIQEKNSGILIATVLEETKSLALYHLNARKGKEVQLLLAEKHLQAPELPTQEIAMEVEERSRRLIMPPSEIFVNVTPTLSYYMFSPNKGDNLFVSDFSNSSQRLGFGAQLGFVYPLAHKFDLRTGLSYFTRKSNISFDVTDDSKKNVVVVDNNSIQINPVSSAMSESNNWQYVELQSDVLYNIKYMQAISVGFKVGMQTSSLNSPLVQARFGYRISKPVADRWALWLEPAVSISLSSQNSVENLFMYRTTGFGLNLGVSLLK